MASLRTKHCTIQVDGESEAESEISLTFYNPTISNFVDLSEKEAMWLVRMIVRQVDFHQELRRTRGQKARAELIRKFYYSKNKS